MKTFLFLFFCFILAVGSPANPSHSELFRSVVNTKKSDSLVFTLFPNPVENKILFIRSSSDALKYIEIYDVLGTMKFSTVTYENRILLDDLKTGIYIFLLQQEDQKGLKRLVIP